MKSNAFSQRDYSLDNIRFLLIFSVVFGHLLEVCAPFAGSGQIYKFIYTFHMPAFIFLFGYNVKYSPKKILYRWCIPYIIMQCAYIAFAKFVLKTNVNFQFTTPYWLLWYMLACIGYQLILPLLDTDSKPKQIITVLSAVGISLAVGYEKTIGYYMSLSRFFVFLPWFLLGCYCKKNDLLARLSVKPLIRFGVLFVSLAIIVVLAPYVPKISKGLLYGSYPYASCAGKLWMRGMTSLIALSVILLLCVGIRPCLNRKLALITYIGQHTWPIFLLHGFFVKLIPDYPHLVSAPWRVLLLTCGILLLAGNKFCSKAVYYICFSWLEKCAEKTLVAKKVGASQK